MRISDWSSDVCSSDLRHRAWPPRRSDRRRHVRQDRSSARRLPRRTGKRWRRSLHHEAREIDLVDAAKALALLQRLVDGLLEIALQRLLALGRGHILQILLRQ